MDLNKKNRRGPDPENLNAIKDRVNNSPYYRHIGMELMQFTGDGCIMKMKIDTEHSNIYGNAHGGALASLADSTCGLSLVTALNEGEYTVTQNLYVTYTRPVPPGILTTRGRIIHRGKTTALLEADIFNESGELVAHALTNHAIRKI
ncbi:MAG: hypothetical protein A2W19_00960 [Spirochaetes bacterium RBG_16_49_21]|nr:MAG: hypothetical protein A2W19_00960 [Spirochaetes bacterium RBG_16_49_21]